MAQSTPEGRGPGEHSSPHGETDYSPASLLRALTSNPLDVEQLRGSDIPHDEAAPPDSRPMRAGTLLLAIALGLLVAVAATQLRAAEAAQDGPRSALVERVQERRDRIGELEGRQERTEQEISSRQEQLLEPGDAVGAKRLADAELVAGTTALAGPGVEIVLEDSAPLPAEPGSEEVVVNRVQDRDIQIVVNGLWEAGAEAISVNGQRVTSTTAIRTAGDAVLVDFRPLSPPYTITAIGDPASLRASYTGSEADLLVLELGERYGIGSSWTAREEVGVPSRARTGLEEARPLDAPTPLTNGDDG
ncbi:DUF881 domain-containing protein [Brachybacterium hainanense]|uniref:DUF881 domain-containing protein n=1 Tax=Brachybacterium hainanense TaxID=1541174 RepID=A0ABV6RCS1_9MICO